MIESVLIIGDSLIEGYGVMEEDNWVSLLEETLKPMTVINRGQNGDFIQNIFHRLKLELSTNSYDLILFEGGVNDFMVGRQPTEVRVIIDEFYDFVSKSNLNAIYLSSPFPVQQGEEPFFPSYAYEPLLNKVESLENSLENEFISLNDALRQNEDYFIDGVHPNEAGHRKIFEHVYKYGLKRSFW